MIQLLQLFCFCPLFALQLTYKLKGQNNIYSEKFTLSQSGVAKYTSGSTAWTGITQGSFSIGGTRGDTYSISLSTGNNGWQSGSWLAIYGPYNQLFFRGWPFTGSMSLSLRIPLIKGDTWKYTNVEQSSNWYTTTPSGSNWSEKAGGGSFPCNNRIYLFRSFDGDTTMTAYEVSVKYRYGIAVYINGEEVYRDLIQEGPITTSSRCIAQYGSASFQNFIRHAKNIRNSNTMAVLIIPYGSVSTIDFDAWVSLYTSSYTNGDCYNPPLTSSSLTDWDTTTSQYVSDSVTFSALANVQANGIALTLGSLGTVTFTIAYGKSGNVYRNARTKSYLITYASFISWGYADMVDRQFLFEPSSPVTVKELSPLVCKPSGAVVTPLLYNYEKYVCYVGEYCHITAVSAPSDCCYSTLTSLPSGLKISDFYPDIKGTPTEASSEQWITVFHTQNGLEQMFRIKLEIKDNGNVVYDGSPYTFETWQTVSIIPTLRSITGMMSISPSLPSGLSFDSSSGTISGSPQEAQSQTKYTITSSGKSIGTVSITVVSRITSFSYPESSYHLKEHNYVNLVPPTVGYVVVYSLSGNLPPRLEFNSTNGKISGYVSQFEGYRVMTVTAKGLASEKSTTVTFYYDENIWEVILPYIAAGLLVLIIILVIVTIMIKPKGKKELPITKPSKEAASVSHSQVTVNVTPQVQPPPMQTATTVQPTPILTPLPTQFPVSNPPPAG